ncbi:hypothetical protein MWN34_02040 [Ancylobacter sp. 6x-1]|uniref:Uncharacterized protein n=1 Tax=Ancylobacter crimeensis TaxID=2579147 RepID=A0ABT0D6V5_9HYPH|nr:hypothetical protein [Ancylobacter crimeensis]MCK0195684.1 hypothetical protein [Ancylobacter crimeensis]
MKRLLLAAVGAASLGLFGAVGGASAAPLGAAAAGINSAQSTAPYIESVAWRKVCRTRNVWRRDRWGHPVRVQIRDCDRVWVGGPRPYRHGPPPPGPGWGPPPPRY